MNSDTASPRTTEDSSQARPLLPALQQIARYDLVSVVFHWLLAAIVITQLSLAWYLHSLATNPPWLDFTFQLHFSLEATSAILVIVLLLWHVVRPPPDLPSQIPASLGLFGHLANGCLYLLLLLLPLRGYLASVFGLRPTAFWGLLLPLWGPEDQALHELFERLHRGLAWLLIGFIVLHLLVLLAYRRQHPGMVSRMLPAWHERRRATPPGKEVLAAQEGRRLARQFRVFGWLGFWIQLCLGLVCLLLLMMAESSSYQTANLASIGPAILWAQAAVASLGLTILAFFYCTRIGKKLLRGPEVSISRRRLLRTLSFVIAGGFVGMSFAMAGAAASIALLIGKTISQPPGIAITDPTKIIRALDVFVLLANFDVIVGHFAGILVSLWLFQRTFRHYLPASGSAPTPESRTAASAFGRRTG